MKTLIIAVLAAVISVVGFTETASAVTECYGYGASTAEASSSSLSRYAQTFIAPSAPIVSITFNLSGDPLNPNSFYHTIYTTVAGVPTNTAVAGSIVSIPVANVLDRGSIGTDQHFDCGDLPLDSKFVYASPITLTPGVMYAMSIHETGAFGSGRLPHVTGFPSITPGEQYVGNPPTWNLTEFPGGSGVNWDVVYAIENQIIDVSTTDGKIDTQIDGLRSYLKLGGEQGGLMFGLIVLAVVFAIGLMSGVPFLVVGSINLLLVGIMSRAEIMPPWVILAVVAIVGVAVVIKVLGSNNGGGQDNEI